MPFHQAEERVAAVEPQRPHAGETTAQAAPEQETPHGQHNSGGGCSKPHMPVLLPTAQRANRKTITIEKIC